MRGRAVKRVQHALQAIPSKYRASKNQLLDPGSHHFARRSLPGAFCLVISVHIGRCLLPSAFGRLTRGILLNVTRQTPFSSLVRLIYICFIGCEPCLQIWPFMFEGQLAFRAFNPSASRYHTSHSWALMRFKPRRTGELATVDP